MQYFVHPSAVVDEGAKIGDHTKIWHFCHVMGDAVIGEYCILGQNVFIADGVVVGNRVKIQNNVSLYSGVQCADDVFLGPSVVFTNVINPRSAINRRDTYQETMVEKGATIGANATIICGIKIGAYAFVGAGSVVTKSVLDYSLVAGNPARQIGWMSEYGERMDFDSDGNYYCPRERKKYRFSNGRVGRID